MFDDLDNYAGATDRQVRALGLDPRDMRHGYPTQDGPDSFDFEREMRSERRPRRPR